MVATKGKRSCPSESFNWSGQGDLADSEKEIGEDVFIKEQDMWPTDHQSTFEIATQDLPLTPPPSIIYSQEGTSLNGFNCRTDKKGRQRHSGDFLKWSHGDFNKDEEEELCIKKEGDNYWSSAEQPSYRHESTFEMVTQDSQQSHILHPPSAVYSQALAPIIHPSRFDKKRKHHYKAKIQRNSGTLQKQAAEYYTKKFRPVACSTPKWQAPMLSIIEARLSQPSTKTIIVKQEMDESQDLVFGKMVFTQNEDRMETQDCRLPNGNLEQTCEGSPSLRCGLDSHLCKNGDQLILRTEMETEEIVFPQSVATVENRDDLSVDLFNLIPEVMVTSYSNTSKDIIFGNTKNPQTQTYYDDYEVKRKSIMSAIEGIVYKTVSSIMQNNRIDRTIMSYERPMTFVRRKR